jgi:hypothetical protein
MYKCHLYGTTRAVFLFDTGGIYVILKVGDKWKVLDSSGKQVLGTHNTRGEAVKQLQVIEADKHIKSKEKKG